MRNRCCTVLVFLITSAAAASDLTIGHVRLTLGMPKDAVLAALSQEFVPKQVSVTEDKYVLWTKAYHSAGSVSFANGKLRLASKTWSDDDAPEESKMADLFAVLAEVTGGQGQSGNIKARTLRAESRQGISGSEIKLIEIELPPDRRIIVQMTKDLPAPGQPRFSASTSVNEVLTDLTRSK